MRPLHSAGAVGDHASVRALLEAGANPNVKQQAGYTPLHTAAHNNDVVLAELLLAHGADRTRDRRRRQTPLALAAGDEAARPAQPAEVDLAVGARAGLGAVDEVQPLDRGAAQPRDELQARGLQRRSSRPCLASSPNSTVAAIS